MPTLMPTLDGLLALIGIAIGLGVGFIAIRKPYEIEENYRTLRQDLLDTRAQLQDALQRLDRAESRIADLTRENLRLQNVILWQQLQFQKYNVKIDPLPEYLRDASKFGNVSINVNSEGGIQITGGDVKAQGDIVGRDKDMQ